MSLNFKKINFTYINNFKIYVYTYINISCFIKKYLRIYYNFENKYVDYPWPNKNSYSNENELNEYISIIENNKIIYYQPKIV